MIVAWHISIQGAIIVGLQNRFKEFRRVKKPRNTIVRQLIPSKPKSPCVGLKRETPEITPGEDGVSFERHNRVLKAEFAKTKPDVQLVGDLMNRTYAMRRKDILTQGHSWDPLSKYPFLQVTEHVSLGGIHYSTLLHIQYIDTFKLAD